MHFSRPFFRSLAAAVVTAVLLTGCGITDDEASTTSARGCVQTYEEGVDYFPDKIELEDAEGFSVEYHDSYQVLTVEEPFDGGSAESFVLVRCGTPAPDLTGALAEATQVEVPVTTLYSGSTTHLPAIIALGALDALTGVSDGSSVSSAEVIAKIEDGSVSEYARGGSIDIESVVAGDPEVLVTGGTESPEYAKLRKAGVPIVANAEWLESTPLGRAEWIKFFAALTGTEAEAERVYDDIKGRYTDVVALVENVEPVEVLPGSAYQGTWYMPAGGSYVRALIDDAGATYPWAGNQSTGSLSLDLEAIVARAAEIETWLINDTTVSTVEDLLDQEDRYAKLTAASAGQVWNATKKLGPTGGNDYWESGVTRPDLVLSDLVAILHPDLLPDHELVYYQRVPQK